TGNQRAGAGGVSGPADFLHRHRGELFGRRPAARVRSALGAIGETAVCRVGCPSQPTRARPRSNPGEIRSALAVAWAMGCEGATHPTRLRPQLLNQPLTHLSLATLD